MKGLLQGFIAFILCLSFVSCQDKSTSALNGSGNLKILATDAPFPFDTISSAKITVSAIDIKSTSGDETEVMNVPVTLDLLTLRNGLVETLSEIQLPAGTYSEALLKISSASVDMKDGRHFDMTVPSGAQTGLKVSITPAITVTTGVSQDLLLDFDLSRSFVALGGTNNLSGFNFKPVIRAISLATTGTISGQVLSVINDVSVSGATITVKQGDVVSATAVSDSDGMFKIIGVAPGNYDVTAEASDYGSLTIDSVPVTQGNEVTTHFILTPASTTP